MRFALMVGLLVGCVDGEPLPPPNPETSCDDGIDNNGNGLVDCDDPDCGGLNCRAVDTGVDLKEVEVILDQSRCCTFFFDETNCQGLVAGSLDVVNRTTEDGNVAFVRCETEDFGLPVGWRVGSGGVVVDRLQNVNLPAESTITIEAVFNCQTTAPFESACEISATAGVFGDDRGFVVRGSP